MEDKFNLTLEENTFLAKRMIVDNIYSNARIEGCNVTFPQTQTILQGVNVANVTLDDINCILNLRDAWKYMINNVEEEFNLNYICKINSYVARNESIEWGVLRTGKVGISGTEYIPEIPQEAEVISKINEINKITSVTKRAITYMLYGMRGQLFWDGNKRTSIILANKILISNGKGVLTVKDSNLNEFNALLTEYYNTNDSKKIEEFLYEKCIYGIEK
jgi:prophage maintenance system killer protein